MIVDAQIESLQEQHKSLEDLILKEEDHSPPDELRITELKKEKLRLKDRISQLEHVA